MTEALTASTPSTMRSRWFLRFGTDRRIYLVYELPDRNIITVGIKERVIAVCFLILPARCHRWNASHNLLCCVRNRVSASSSKHVRCIVRGARHCSLPFGSTSRLSQMECRRSYWKFPVDVISQEMIQVTRHVDVPQRKAPSRSKPTMFQMTTPPLSAPDASVALRFCSSQGSSAARLAESTAHLSRSTCTATSCCQVARCICVVIRAPLRSCINMHYYGLFGFCGYVLNMT